MTETGPLALNPYWRQWSEQAAKRAAPDWPAMVDELRRLQDMVAATAPPADVTTQVRDLLASCRRLLEPHVVDDAGQIYGKLLQIAGRGQTLIPPLHVIHRSSTELNATTMFGRFHSGSNQAVHGGAIALLFDEALGSVADLGGRPRSRTAELRVKFRSVTPIDRQLSVRVKLVEEDGRKRRLHSELRDDERLCAEAEGLFVALRDRQP